jgi:hypothetical protein
MGKASRTKRRAAVRSAKRTRTNSWWYGLTALVVIVGVSLIVYAHLSAPPPVGPYVANQNNPTDPHNRDSHWHAALGVYDCDHWMGDTPNSGVWQWPATANINGQTVPGRVGENLYAGMHSHNDGIIHMEPQSSDESGRHATVGKYFDFGGWKLSSSSFDFLGTKVSDGDKCPNGQPGKLTWALAKWDGKGTGPQDPPPQQKYTLQSGNPADHKLDQGDIVVIAFLPPGQDAATLANKQNPPSLPNLPGALGVSESGPSTPPASLPNEGPTNPPASSVPATSAATSPTTTK